NAPLTIAGFRGCLHVVEVLDDLWPFDAAFHIDDAALGIEAQDAIEAAHVQEDVGVAELLPSHGVTTAGNRHRLALRSSTGHSGAHFVHRPGPDDGVDARGIELGVNVVDEETLV